MPQDWSINADDFLKQVNPYMQRKTADHYEGGGEGATFVAGGKDVNSWSQGKVDEGMTLTLGDGRKWVPAGGDAGVTFHPKGEVTQGGWVGGANGGYAQVINDSDYYDVVGDIANLDPSNKGGDQKVTVRYKQVGDKMVPMEDPHVQGYKHGAWNNGLREFAAMAAMAVGGWALAPVAGAGTGAAVAGTATAASASGAAGMMGMAPGMAATAVNTGLLSTGVSLAQGHNLQDSLKTGITSGALSGFGGWASDTIGSATAGLGATTSKVLSTVGSGAITGGAGAVLTGQDIGEGMKGGIISSGIRAIGNVASNEVKDLVGTDNPVAGRIAGGVVNSAITGSSPLGVMVGEVTKTVGGFDTLSKEQQATVNSVVASAIKGKKLTPKQIIDLAAATVKDVKQS